VFADGCNEHGHAWEPTTWVAVGTRITPRPPHRSRRALLTHRAPPSGQTSAARGLRPHALRRTAANRIDVASRLSVRTTAACRLFPSGEALPSTTSAGSCLPLFGRFLGTTTSSDFSSAYMLGVRLLPSRAGPARVRARVRPPRFRAKNFSTCTRCPVLGHVLTFRRCATIVANDPKPSAPGKLAKDRRCKSSTG
jgi:hypothetical protein